MPGTQKAPGLIWRKRSDGTQVPYWAARQEYVKAGYLPRMVRLHYEIDDPMLAARCHTLQAEMLEWAADNGNRPPQFDGTFASLVRFYEKHPDSPYLDIHPKSQRTYSKTMALLMKHKGTRLVAAVDGADIKRWYKELTEARSRSWAYYTINVLKAVLAFGASKRIRECKMLREELRATRFRAGRRRTEQLTYEQVAAFRAKARELGYAWMGRCVTLQFDFGMRRRDVIGEYIAAEPGAAGIRNGRRVWHDGLTWNHIDDNGIVRKLISKTKFTSEYTAAHAIADYPDVVDDLATTPLEKRIGPLVIYDRTGVPPTEEQCRRYFRVIARACGIPDAIKNMDARAGAVTEAYDAAATEEEAMALATHSERKTSHGYQRDLTEPSRRAAAKRLALRKERRTRDSNA